MPRSHCKRGHPFTGDNFYHNGRGVRICRVCRRGKNREYQEAVNADPDKREIYLVRMRRAANARHTRLRMAALEAYGGKCACCGEEEEVFLTIDHVGGGGNVHREELSNGRGRRTIGSATLYRWLAKNGYPPGFQVLCHNCNYAEDHGGCPHKVNSIA